ncbi:hypothetical protein V6N13_111462 [Hibiscus sabdariffa]
MSAVMVMQLVQEFSPSGLELFQSSSLPVVSQADILATSHIPSATEITNSIPTAVGEASSHNAAVGDQSDHHIQTESIDMVASIHVDDSAVSPSSYVPHTDGEFVSADNESILQFDHDVSTHADEVTSTHDAANSSLIGEQIVNDLGGTSNSVATCTRGKWM